MSLLFDGQVSSSVVWTLSWKPLRSHFCCMLKNKLFAKQLVTVVH